MKVIDSKNNVVVNDNGIIFIPNRRFMSPEEIKQLEKIVSVIEVKYSPLINTKKTEALGNFYPTKRKPNIFHVFEDKDIIKQFPNTKGYIYQDIIPLIKEIPERFRGFGVNIYPFIERIEIKKLDDGMIMEAAKISNKYESGGKYIQNSELIKFAYPVLFFNDKTIEFKTKDNVKRSYSNFVKNSYYNLLHELKHAENSFLVRKIIQSEGISYESLIDLCAYDEISAEFQSLLYRIADHLKGKYENSSVPLVERLFKHIKTYDNYFYHLKEVFNFIFDDHYRNLMKNGYTLNYFETHSFDYIKDFACKENFKKCYANKDSFEKIKCGFFDFEIYNPETKKMDLVNCSNYFQSMNFPKTSLLKLKKFLNKEIEKQKKLRNEENISSDLVKRITKFHLQNMK